MPPTGELYDVVLLRHVIEHLPDAGASVRALSGNLEPEGIIVIATPNFESWTARVLGVHWYWMTLPAHLNYFTPRSVRQLLESSGYRIEACFTRRGDFPNYPIAIAAGLSARAGFKRKISGALGGLVQRPAGIRGVVRDAVFALAAAIDLILFRPFGPFLDRAFLSEELWVVGRIVNRPADRLLGTTVSSQRAP
jgi:SAM-dependent methyltransferase